MKLLGNRLLLRPLKPSLRTQSGLHLIEGYQDDRQQWKVLQLGTRYTGDLKVGDYVVCTGYHGNLHQFDDGSIIVGAEAIKTDIIAVWTGLANLSQS